MPNYAADSNIWLRIAEPSYEQSAVATQAVATILKRFETVYLLPQIGVEFWRVITGNLISNRNGFGRTPEQADQELRQLEIDFPMLQDTPEVYSNWRMLVRSVGVSGAKVYDARIAAAMLAHGVTHLLTFNGQDFQRFLPWGIVAVHPAQIMPSPKTEMAAE